MSKIVITRKDVVWGYVAQGCNIGANIFILPAIFRYLPSNTLGIWYIFVNLGMFATLIGLVFQTSFSRNISYAFGGATSLIKEGIDSDADVLGESNFPLIKSLIHAMRRFYGYVSAVMIVFLILIGSLYIRHLSRDLHDQDVIITSWILYSLSVVASFYCLYFSCILQGRGYIKEYNQLVIINRLVYMVLVFGLLYSGYGILGIAIANCISTIINFILGNALAYKDGLRQTLKQTEIQAKDLMGIIWQNTYKLGLANMALFFSTRGSLFYASLFLPLATVAKYGLSIQVVNVFGSVSLLYYYSYSTYISQSWVTKELDVIRRIYSKSLVLFLFIYIVGCISILLLGDWALDFIGSGTTFLPTLPLALLFVVYLLDSNQTLALNLISSENKVPYLASSLWSALGIFILIPVFIRYFDWGIVGAILAVGVVQLCYQNWKWVLTVSEGLDMSYIQQIKYGVSNWLGKERSW